MYTTLHSKPDEYFFNMVEDSEVIIPLISGDTDKKLIEKKVTGGYFKEFYYYEIIANYAPVTLLCYHQKIFNKSSRMLSDITDNTYY